MTRRRRTPAAALCAVALLGAGGCGAAPATDTAAPSWADARRGLVDAAASDPGAPAGDGRPLDDIRPSRARRRSGAPARLTAATPEAAVAAYARELLALPEGLGGADAALERLARRSVGQAQIDALAARRAGLRGRRPVARLLVVAPSGAGFLVVARRGVGAVAVHELYRADARRQRGGWAVSAWRQLR